MVHRIEILKMRPRTARMTPRMIIVVPFFEPVNPAHVSARCPISVAAKPRSITGSECEVSQSACSGTHSARGR